MIYEYRNHKSGQTREILASMRQPPPERVVFDADGGHAPAADDADEVWCRVWSVPLTTVREYGIIPHGRHGLPVSRMLPLKNDNIVHVQERNGTTIRTHADGTRTDSMGRRLIENRADYERAKKTTGAVEE